MNLFLALALVGCVAGILVRRRNARVGGVLLLLSVAVGVACALRVLVGGGTAPERVRPAMKMARALGHGLAVKAQESCPEGGRILVLHFPAFYSADASRRASFFQGLQEGLDTKRFEIIDGLRDARMEGEPLNPFSFERGIPAEQLVAWIGDHGNVDAVIVYLPGLHVPGAELMKDLSPALVVIAESQRQAWAKLLRDEAIEGLLAFKGLANGLPSSREGESWTDVFDDYFTWQ